MRDLVKEEETEEEIRYKHNHGPTNEEPEVYLTYDKEDNEFSIELSVRDEYYYWVDYCPHCGKSVTQLKELIKNEDLLT